MDLSSLSSLDVTRHELLRGNDESKFAKLSAASLQSKDARATFDSFVGETFYGQLLSAMRQTQEKPAYFDGGRAEEVFRGQLDQTLAQEMTKASASSFTGPMFDQFQLTTL